MLDVVYGSKSEMVSRPDNRPLLEDIAQSNIRVGVMLPLYYMKNSVIDKYLFSSSIVARYRFLNFVKTLLRSKKDEKGTESNRKSVYWIIMGSNDGEGLGNNEIAAESTNLIVAGQLSLKFQAFVNGLRRSASILTACSPNRF